MLRRQTLIAAAALALAFAAHYKGKTGDTVTVKASHGGSGKQARSVTRFQEVADDPAAAI